MQACTVADPGEGQGGPGPPYCYTKLRPKGLKKIFWRLPPPPLSTDAYKNITNIDRCKLNVPIKGAWACQACVFLELQFILN